jgi:hypothetical protein
MLQTSAHGKVQEVLENQLSSIQYTAKTRVKGVN